MSPAAGANLIINRRSTIRVIFRCASMKTTSIAVLGILAAQPAFGFLAPPPCICGPVTLRLGLRMMAESDTSMRGKVVLVTGCNSGGMGSATAAALMRQDAHVIGVSRSDAGTINELSKHGPFVPAGDVQPASFSCVSSDLASLDSVRAAASDISNLYTGGIDVMVANAGIMAPPFAQTVDGYESQVQINFLSQFLLVRLLADSKCLNEGEAKVIQISSLSSERASFAADDLSLINAAKCSADSYDGMAAYRLSKLAQVLAAPEIATRLKVESYSVHPGVVNTPLFYKNVSPTMRPLLSGLAGIAGKLGAVRSPEQGAETAVFLASKASGVGGDNKSRGLYWADKAVRKPNPQLEDIVLRDSLWRQASDLVGLPP